ncbi:uncharacterized protein [Solanum lycopersicum]|uniref:uncharacterized protein n=1 Tax=Solanum lycopersicum TaxID=4081 RepID=UPI003749CD78
MTIHVTRDIGPRVNALESTITYRLKDFVRMNTPIFLVSKVGKAPQEFLDSVYKVLSFMGVSSKEKAELASYQLREVDQECYTRWKYNSLVESGPRGWEEFKEAFLGKYFPRERREVKAEEFNKFRQGNMSVEEYFLKFTMLSRFKKKDQNYEGPSDTKVKGESGSSSQGVKPTCSSCGKQHFGKCIVGTENCFGCGKDGIR